MRREMIMLAGLLLAVGVGILALRTLAPGAPEQYVGARHVIFISFDTTRPDHFGCMGAGWARTPRIDAFAAESTLYTDYLNVANTTLSSHASLMTGKYPSSHGTPRNGFMVNEQNEMLAETLKASGFSTAGFLGSFALDSRFGFAQGFDHFDQEFDTYVGDNGADQNQRRAQAVTDAALSYLDKAGIPKRLFLFLHYFDPHWPYDPPPPYDTLFAAQEGAPGLPLDGHPTLALAPRDAQTRAAIARYSGEISYLDEHIGRLLDGLRSRGVLDDALVVVTSDHGENLGEHWGRPFDHGWTAYQTEVHGLCIIRRPGGGEAVRCAAPLMSIDIAPSVLTFLGLRPPAGHDGEVFDLRVPPAVSERTRFSEATKPWEQVEPPNQWFNIHKPTTVLRGEHKLIVTGYRRMTELYDLSRDPLEQNNRLQNDAVAARAIADQLRDELDAWRAAARPLPTRFEASQREETIRRLRSMGYIGDSTDEDDASESQSSGEDPG